MVALKRAPFAAFGVDLHLQMESLFNADPDTFKKLMQTQAAVVLLRERGVRIDEGDLARLYGTWLQQWPVLRECFNPWRPIHKFPLGEQLELEHEISGVGKYVRMLTFNMEHQLHISTLDAELPSVPVPIPWTARARYLCVEGGEE